MASNASYKGRRMTLPRLANNYCAIQEDFQYAFDGNQLMTVPVALSANINSLYKFEPIFNPGNLINSSPLATAMFQRYNEFRIRKVTVRVTPTLVSPSNQERSDVWVFWCPNHAVFDADEAKGEAYSTVTDIAEASRFQHVRMLPGRSFSLDYVPQVIFNNAVSIGGVATDQSGDGKMPWMSTTAANKDNLLLRAPIFYFRRPYMETTVANAAPIVKHQYQVIILAVIEYRSLSDDN